MTKNITLITGFLGAGKTTLLNSLVANNPNIRYAVIENEIGSEGIDGELIDKTQSPLIELNDGCICCSLSGEMYTALNALLSREKEWDELIIEATGIADPAEIARPFLTEPEVMRYFCLKRVICVVDAALIEDELRDTDIAIGQISLADILLINKIEQVAPKYLNGLKSVLENINPMASVIVADGMDKEKTDRMIEVERILPQQKAERPIFSLGRTAVISKQEGLAPFSISGSHKRHAHSDIETLLLRFNDAFDLTTLEHWLRVFLFIQSNGIYRIKCIINDDSYSEKIIVQSVGQRLSVTYGQPWVSTVQRESKVVIIGKQLQTKGLEKIFTSCLNKKTIC